MKKLTLEVFAYLLLGGLIDNALSDYLWARSVVLTSPTVATVGLGLTIPLAMVSDALLGKEYPSILECVGAILVLGGFVIVSIGADDTNNSKDKSHHSISNGINNTSRSMQEIGNRMMKQARDNMFTSVATTRDKHSDNVEMVGMSSGNNGNIKNDNNDNYDNDNPFHSRSSSSPSHTHRTMKGGNVYGQLPSGASV